MGGGKATKNVERMYKYGAVVDVKRKELARTRGEKVNIEMNGLTDCN